MGGHGAGGGAGRRGGASAGLPGAGWLQGDRRWSWLQGEGAGEKVVLQGCATSCSEVNGRRSRAWRSGASASSCCLAVGEKVMLVHPPLPS